MMTLSLKHLGLSAALLATLLASGCSASSAPAPGGSSAVGGSSASTAGSSASSSAAGASTSGSAARSAAQGAGDALQTVDVDGTRFDFLPGIALRGAALVNASTSQSGGTVVLRPKDATAWKKGMLDQLAAAGYTQVSGAGGTTYVYEGRGWGAHIVFAANDGGESVVNYSPAGSVGGASSAGSSSSTGGVASGAASGAGASGATASADGAAAKTDGRGGATASAPGATAETDGEGAVDVTTPGASVRVDGDGGVHVTAPGAEVDLGSGRTP